MFAFPPPISSCSQDQELAELRAQYDRDQVILFLTQASSHILNEFKSEHETEVLAMHQRLQQLELQATNQNSRVPLQNASVRSIHVPGNRSCHTATLPNPGIALSVIPLAPPSSHTSPVSPPMPNTEPDPFDMNMMSGNQLTHHPDVGLSGAAQSTAWPAPSSLEPHMVPLEALKLIVKETIEQIGVQCIEIPSTRTRASRGSNDRSTPIAMRSAVRKQQELMTPQLDKIWKVHTLVTVCKHILH